MTGGGKLRSIHEFLFSLNFVLVIEFQQVTLGRFSVPSIKQLSRLQFEINRCLSLHAHSQVGFYIPFFFSVAVLASCMFALIRITSKNSMVSAGIRSIGGLISLLLLPASTLYLNYSSPWHFLGGDPGIAVLPGGALLLECALAGVCGVLYLFGRWPFPRWASIGLLVFHFTFWGWVSNGGILFVIYPTRLVYSLAGLCSSLVWGSYLVSSKETSPVPGDE